MVANQKASTTTAYRQMIIDQYGPFLTVADLTKILKRSRTSVDAMLHRGELPAAKIGGQYRMETAALFRWWDQQVMMEQKNLLIRLNP